MVRKVTNELIEQAQEGALSWESIAMAALCYLSEDDVKDMAHANELPYSGANYMGESDNGQD